jgi:hypothetical protein
MNADKNSSNIKMKWDNKILHVKDIKGNIIFGDENLMIRTRVQNLGSLKGSIGDLKFYNNKGIRNIKYKEILIFDIKGNIYADNFKYFCDGQTIISF